MNKGLNEETLCKIDSIILNNKICCLTCNSFKVCAENVGMCKNDKSNLYLISVSFVSVIAPLIYEKSPTTTRSGKCLFYKSYIDGKTNDDMLVECVYCKGMKPYKDFYDKFAYFCSKECRQNFNDDFNTKWMEEVNRKNKYYHKLQEVYQ